MVDFGTDSNPPPKSERIQRYFTRGGLLAAMLCAAAAVWFGATDRGAADTKAIGFLAAWVWL